MAIEYSIWDEEVLFLTLQKVERKIKFLEEKEFYKMAHNKRRRAKIIAFRLKRLADAKRKDTK